MIEFLVVISTIVVGVSVTLVKINNQGGLK